MKIFNLPDLGEGLPDAEIHEWFIKVGDHVTVDQPLVSVETAKAIVEVPSPYTGKISKLFGKAGDIINTGAPFIEFELEEQTGSETGTVVGSIESTNKTIEETMSVQSSSATTIGIKVTPAVRALAKRLNVDLSFVTPSSPNGVISAADVENASKMMNEAGELLPLRGARRVMMQTMQKSHAEVVPVTLCDDADIHAWKANSDISVRLIKALIYACQQEPSLNAWFDSQATGRRLHQSVNLGIAIDTGEELYVPVIKTAEKMNSEQLRATLNRFKQQAKERAIPAEELRGPSITLSNFGNFAGRYANPIVVPPTVAILGVGKIRDEVVASQGDVSIHKVIPLSLTFDHRAVTGGEASRFLGHVIAALEKNEHE